MALEDAWCRDSWQDFRQRRSKRAVSALRKGEEICLGLVGGRNVSGLNMRTYAPFMGIHTCEISAVPRRAKPATRLCVPRIAHLSAEETE